MKNTLYLIISFCLLLTACKKDKHNSSQTINGAGASFPFPVYSRWAYDYHQKTGVKINYQSVGSGAGIAQIKKKTVDFGASDKPLKQAELEKSGLIQFPTVMGGVVPVINVSGIKAGELKLDSTILANIFMGKIKFWDDQEIAKINPELSLPHQEINVVRRSDGSGTTWIFTNYLSKVSSAWKEKVGNGKAVKWPVGIGGKGNEGVAANVKKIEGAVGYVEYAYALQAKLNYIQLRNQDGNYVKPEVVSFQAAAANAKWSEAPGFYMVLTNQPGAKSWPITGATFILLYQKQSNPEVAKNILNFFNWTYTNGDEAALKLHYVPMPDSVVKLIRKKWKTIEDLKGNKIWN
ncbi:MAG: phosphate ABC transporter substrate-binding protein PstS [Myxococcota bacterium]